MFYLSMNLISLMTSTMFSFMKHPLSMGLMLLVQTTFICVLTGMLTKTFWFSYVLFLIFLGGMLVLFIYVTSLASNEMFNFSMKFFSLNLLLLSTLFIIMMFMDKKILLNYMNNFETNSLLFTKNLLNENTLMLNKLYNFPINMITILLMIYLFLTLIAVVKITDIFEGPLRPSFN